MSDQNPSAGPSSPSPAEELYAAALDIHLAMFERSAPRHSARIAATLPILSALVLSVEERTLREAAKDVEDEPELPGEMPERAKLAAALDPQEYSRNVVRVTKRNIAERLRSRLASLKETRER